MLPANLALLFMFRPITLKELDGLTLIVTFNCHGGLEVTHQIAVQEVSGSIPGTVKVFYVWFLLFVYVLLSNVYS